VVAFRQGGMADLIEHRRNGYLAEPFDPADLARGVAWCLDSLGLASSSTRLQSWSSAAVAAAHQDLYRQVLQR
jgi:glycosyltransferase involved in cell wall biosynthesis